MIGLRRSSVEIHDTRVLTEEVDLDCGSRS